MNEVEEVVIGAALKRELGHEVNRINRMSKLKGLGAMLKDGIAEFEKDAEGLMQEFTTAREEKNDVFGKAREEIAQYRSAVGEVREIFSTASNGGPPLGN